MLCDAYDGRQCLVYGGPSSSWAPLMLEHNMSIFDMLIGVQISRGRPISGRCKSRVDLKVEEVSQPEACASMKSIAH